MPRNYSAHFRSRINATAADEAPLILLEIAHPTLATPIRVVNDTQDLVSNGNLYVGVAFAIWLPDDIEGQMPRARLAIDNVGRELVEPIENSGGAQGATVRVMQVLRSQPDVIEWEATLDMRNVEMTQAQITGELGYEDILNRPAIAMRYDPASSPGLF
jgi:hypothetical protein